jgi:iron complex outermembrane receptor protein/hemoglobin/transferrin/lactoferrin receptor protein
MHWIGKVCLLNLVLYTIIGFYPYSAFAETAEETYILKEITVTGTRGEKDTFETPRSVSVATGDEIERRSLLNAADILREEAGVQAQKTYGQGSPIIRGLTGYHTLILIDGVRLNNSTFRSGPNQYMATIDPGQIERMEVVRGPGSVLYGSSAIGGVIHTITKMPVELSGRFSIRPRIFTRFSSADSSKLARLEFSGGYDKLSFIAGGSYKDVGDLRPGRGYDIQLPSKKFLLTSESDPKDLPEGAWLIDIESPTGWQESDGDLKVNYRISDKQDVKLAYQMVRQQDIPRYDKLATGEFDIYFFDPQNRDLAYANYTARKIAPLIDILQTSASYHRQEEGRRQQKAKSTSLKETNDVTDTLGLSLQLTSLLGARQKLTYGGEFYHDTVGSEGVTTDLDTGEKKTKAWGRFPDGSVFWDINAYLQDEIRILDNLEVALAGRYTRFSTQADLGIRYPAFGAFESSGDAVTGSFGLVYGITENLNFVFNAGQAFRAPSLNDTTAVEVTNEGIDAPSPDLDSERSIGIDVGFKTRFRHFSGSINYYFSRIGGLVTRVPVEEAYAGKELPRLYADLQDSYEGIPVFVKDNIKKSNIQGVELDLVGAIPYLPGVSAHGNLAFTRGKDIDNDQPIRREQPLNGLLGLRWEDMKSRFWVEFYSRFADRQDRLSSGDRRDPRIPGLTRDPKEDDPRAGTPGWFTLNIRTGINIADQTRLMFGVENITDRRYREHGSGVDGPGTNFAASMDRTF